MPIYAYKCESCGHAKDVLQKMSDPVLSECPACGIATFKKQLTAAGFQLKGSGWYVTDFRQGDKAGKGAESHQSSEAASSTSTPASPPAPAESSVPASPAPAPAPAVSANTPAS